MAASPPNAFLARPSNDDQPRIGKFLQIFDLRKFTPGQNCELGREPFLDFRILREQVPNQVQRGRSGFVPGNDNRCQLCDQLVIWHSLTALVASFHQYAENICAFDRIPPPSLDNFDYNSSQFYERLRKAQVPSRIVMQYIEERRNQRAVSAKDRAQSHVQNHETDIAGYIYGTILLSGLLPFSRMSKLAVLMAS
jgi:hypothetical protein